MTKPKNMTPELEQVWREKKRAYDRFYHLLNRDKHLERQRKYRQNIRDERAAVLFFQMMAAVGEIEKFYKEMVEQNTEAQ